MSKTLLSKNSKKAAKFKGVSTLISLRKSKIWKSLIKVRPKEALAATVAKLTTLPVF